MKVVHVISGLSGGGAEHLVAMLCRLSLADNQITMEVVSLSSRYEIESKFAGVELFPFSHRPQQHLTSSKWRSSLRAIKYLLSIDADVLHAHMVYGCLAACIVKLFRPRTRIIFTLHNSRQPGVLRKTLLYLSRTLRFADIIFPNSRPAWYQKKNAVVIGNAVEHTEKFADKEEKYSVFTCLFAGRLEKQKQPQVLISTAEKLRTTLDFRIIVAGEGKLRTQLEEEVAAKDLGSYFEFKGFVGDITTLLRRSHCLLLPSLYEGMPLVVLEASKFQLPVVATPAAVAAFALTGKEIYISSPEKFHEAIAEINHNYQLALKRAAILMEKLSVHSPENCYSAHKELYDKAVLQHSNQGS